ncbi:delta-lactam-biosynthetic de-N-acetylase [Evansella cellulosilytica]|uniref:Delta-lactam-biosynthetic de-N-acetylase n=1 Tax=Evansella cellulosilytica (strain ATCC 21833 / DSM 2522 / FERM P-1141 / JCM 9156 / N-4) TaxID=649639 RepID=E6U0P3_EVAC2|nr:delta-lactam-biosynthetic de-N-acetylase [Evansella cellulosilytica]ADU29091.1 delta-lactam-biosynthetic de-N-acetylase [Evansella cellulosilytica DSM 2522]
MLKLIRVPFISLALLLLIGAFANLAFAAESNEEHHWSFKPSKNNEPASTEPLYEELLNKYGGFYIGDTTKKELYLTFDNGYENGYTAEVLDVLKEKEIPATFFVTGHYLDTERELIHRMVDEGHIVGNHSYHHPSLPKVDDDRLKRELENLRELYEEVTGRDDMRYLRPPRGTFSERSLARSAELGYINVFWSFAYKDWETDNQKGMQYAYDNIMKRVHPGAILLLHSVSSDNAEALPKVIDDLRKEGYTFKSLDDLTMQKSLIPVANE